MEVDGKTEDASQNMNVMLKQQSQFQEKASDTEMLQLPSSQAHHDGATDNVFASQESVITDDGGRKTWRRMTRWLLTRCIKLWNWSKRISLNEGEAKD